MKVGDASEEPLMVEPLAMAAFLVALLGLILPVIPAIVALVLAHYASKRIANEHGLIGGMSWVRAAQVLAAVNILIFGGIMVAAIYLMQ